MPFVADILSDVMAVSKRVFGTLSESSPSQIKEVHAFTLSGEIAPGKPIEVEILTLGGVISRISVPDRDGKIENVTLGFDNLHSYETESPFFGCIVGRFGNRIANGRFEIEGEVFQLPTNEHPAGGNAGTLHGGPVGFDKHVWNAKVEEETLVLYHTSPDGDQGFPGELAVVVRYRLEGGALVIEYEAETTATTHVNLTNHAYFNLDGEAAGDILGHTLTLNAGHYTPVNNSLIPTGEIRSVSGTPFDFTAGHVIGDRIENDDDQLKIAGGYDHNFVLDRASEGLMLAARVDSKSGRSLEVWTSEPGIQFYSGNFLDGTRVGPSGTAYQKRAGFCLETQKFPDAPNQPDFPSTLLHSGGDRLKSRTEYRFLV